MKYLRWTFGMLVLAITAAAMVPLVLWVFHLPLYGRVSPGDHMSQFRAQELAWIIMEVPIWLAGMAVIAVLQQAARRRMAAQIISGASDGTSPHRDIPEVHSVAEDELRVKQVIVIRRDLGMRRGKECAQSAHASMAWLTRRLQFTDPGRIFSGELSPAERAWAAGSFRKVVCQVASGEELLAVYEKAKAAGLEVNLITDAGLTEFRGVPTNTCLACGPDYDDRIDPVTGDLRLY